MQIIYRNSSSTWTDNYKCAICHNNSLIKVAHWFNSAGDIPMINPFIRNKSQNTGLLLDRLIKPNNNPISLIGQNKNQQNILIQQNSNKMQNQQLTSKINKTESIEIIEKHSRDSDDKKDQKHDVQFLEQDGKTKKQASNSPNKKVHNVFENLGQKQGKKQYKINRGKQVKLKILNQKNEQIGQLQIDNDYLSPKTGAAQLPSKITKLQLQPKYRKQCQQAWCRTQHYQNILNISLKSTNLSILSTIIRSPNKPMPDNIIRRLRSGFQFYDFRNDREQAITALLGQYSQFGINRRLCQYIRRICQRSQQGLKIDGLLALYCCANGREDNYEKFLMEDLINLVRIYQQLMKSGRLSSRKLVKPAEQTSILQSIPKYYSKYLNNPLSSQLAKQFLTLLSILLINQKAQISSQQFLSTFVPIIKQLQQLLSNNPLLKPFVNVFMVELFVNWELELQGVQLGGAVEQFVDYYRRNRAVDGKQLSGFMAKLSQFTIYDGPMQAMIAAKCQSFIKQNLNHNPISTKQAMINTAMQSIFLLRQCKKANIKYPKLLEILYKCCPVSTLPFLQSIDQHMDLILPLVCRYYKISPNKSPQLTIPELNQNLPPSYSLPNSQTYLILNYLIKLLLHFSHKVSVESCYQKLQDIQETLLKFNASSIITESSDFVPYQIVKLICKYVTGFGSEGRDREGLVESGYQVVELIFSAIQALIDYFQNEGCVGEKQLYGRLICNVEMLGCIIMSSGILIRNRQKQSIKRKQKQIENNAHIWSSYIKLCQFLIKLSLTRQFPQPITSKKLLQKTCIKIYEEYSSKIKQTSRWLKFKIYVETLLTLLKLESATKQLNEILAIDRKSKLYNFYNLLEEVILNRNVDNQGIDEADWRELVGMGIILLATIFNCQQQAKLVSPQIQSWLSNINATAMNNVSYLIQLCLNKLYEQRNNPKFAINSLHYCQLISYILECQNKSTLSINKPHKTQITLIKIISKPSSAPFSKQPITAHQLISTIFLPSSSSKLQVLFSLMAATYDEELFKNIMELGHLPTILSSTLNLLQTPIKQSREEETWLITCMDMFACLYFRRYIQVQMGNGSAIAKAILHLLKSPSSTSRYKLTQYLQIILPLISQNTSNESYQTLLTKFLSHIAHLDPNRQSQKNNKEQTLKYYVVLIQVLMVYLNDEGIILGVFQGRKQGSGLGLAKGEEEGKGKGEVLLGDVVGVVCIVYDGLDWLGYWGEKSLMKWARVLGVITLKISQLTIIFQTISSKNMATLATKLISSINNSLKSILSWLDQSLNQTIKQLLYSSVEVLKSQKSQSKSYAHDNEAIVGVSMLERQSFINYFVGLSKHILSTYLKLRRNNTKPATENYRCYYLLYYFLNRVLQDPTGRYVNYLYQNYPQDYLTTQAKLQSSIKQAFINLLNELTQCGSKLIGVEAWHIVLVHSLLKLQPRLIRTGTIYSKVVKFCCNLLEILESMGQQADYLEGWLCYVEVLNLMCFIYQTNCYYDDNSNRDALDFLSKVAYLRVWTWMAKWEEIRPVAGSKFVNFPLWPISVSSFSRQKFAKKPTQILNQSKVYNFQLSPLSNATKANNNQTNKIEEASQNDKVLGKSQIWYYLKAVMVLLTLHKMLRLYRLDVQAKFRAELGFKVKLIEFTQRILAQFSAYYDQYFGQNQNALSNQNIQSLKKGIELIAKDPQITNHSCYLNKVLTFYALSTENIFTTRRTNRHDFGSNNVYTSKSRELSATSWFNGIEDSLNSMGEKASYKFMTGKMNGVMGSRTGSVSMRASTSRIMH